MPPPSSTHSNTTEKPIDKRKAARDVIDILHEISTLLNTHLDRTQLSLCVSLLENGVNPEALATVIKDLRREGDLVRAQMSSGTQQDSDD